MELSESSFEPRLSIDELLKKVSNNLLLDQYKSVSEYEKMNALTHWQQNWFYSTDEVVSIYHSLYDSMQASYLINKKKNHAERAREIYDLNKVKRNFNLSNGHTTSFSIVGIGGVGKSTIVRTILAKCFDAITIEPTGGKLKFVYTDCLDIGSVKQLFIRFIKFVNSSLGTDYPTEFIRRGEDTNSIERLIESIVNNHKIYVWIIDEIDGLAGLAFDNMTKVNSLLKSFSGRTGLSIVYMGSPNAKKVLTYNYQIGRRADGIGSIILDRFHYKFDKNLYDDYNTKWVNFNTAFWRRQVLENQTELTKELSDTYYECSAGVIGKAIALHIKVQKEALLNGIESIDSDLIRKVDKQFFSMSAPMINALASGNRDLINSYPDLSIRVVQAIDDIKRNYLNPKDFADFIDSNDFNKEEKSALLKVYIGLKRKN